MRNPQSQIANPDVIGTFRRKSQIAPRSAFTMLELLLVIGIIVLLAAILVPVVSQVRMRAYVATTTGEMQRIMTACTDYYHDFNAYPGPLSNSQLSTGNPPTPGPSPNTVNMKLYPSATVAGFDPTQITSSENLVLGLLGLLTAPASAQDANAYYAPPPPAHDVMSLNYNRPASYHFIDFLPDELSSPNNGYYAYINVGGSFPATDFGPQSSGPTTELTRNCDSVVPEFVDHIPSAMPILYMRANVGTSGVVATGLNPPAQFDRNQLGSYGFQNVNKTDYLPGNVTPPGVTVPTDGTPVEWVVYLMSPTIVNQPRGKDTFILISAGPDRLYGTKDDILISP